MDVQLTPVPLDEVETAIRHHLAGLPSAVDSYVEERILASTHYRIAVSGQDAGFAAVHDGSTVTQFSVGDRFKRAGQLAFWRLRRLEQVQGALAPTYDEFFLSHALDDHRQVAIQAYLFAAGPDVGGPVDAAGWSQRPAVPGDIDLVVQESGDFFGDVEALVGKGELFVTQRQGDPVAFGIVAPSRLLEGVASVGMFTIERQRSAGAGSATIALLLRRCRDRGVTPVAGCWTYNHFSKRALERAGMLSPTRLLKIDY
jgi:GNAT superfamily N-acetyltransferase